MAIDPNIIFKQDKFSDAFKAGQDIAQTALKNPVELQQAQAALQSSQLANQFTEQNMPTKLSQEQATLQSTLTSNEAEKLKVAQQKRDMEMKAWLDQYKPPRTQDGQIDAGKLYDDMTKAGFGQYATAHIASQFQNSASQIKNAGDMVKLATDTAKTYSQAISSLPADQRKVAIQKADDYSKSLLGRSFSEILGPNWAGSSQYMGISPMDRDQNERSNIAAANTADAKDPGSALNQKFAKFLADNFPDLPVTTLSQAAQLPGYKDVMGSFQISAQERGEAGKTGATIAAKVSTVQSLMDRMQKFKDNRTIRPLETVSQALKRLVNTPEASELQAVIDEAKAQGIELTGNMDMSGASRTLKSRIDALQKEAGQAQRTQTATTRPSSIGAPAGKTLYLRADGGRMYLTPDQIKDPRVQAAIKAGQIKKGE